MSTPSVTVEKTTPSETVEKGKKKKQEDLLTKCQKLVEAKVYTEDFICEIEKHPSIWNCTVNEYSDKHAKLNGWNQIISTFIADFEDQTLAEKNILMTIIQKKWKCIQGCYTREILRLKGIKSGSAASRKKQYIYFDQLRFLETSVKNTTSSIDEVTDGEENEAPTSQYIDHVDVPSGSRKRSNKDDELVEVLKKKIAIEEAEARTSASRDEQDEDKMFLLSMLTEIRKVPAERKIKLRCDMMSLVAMAQTNQPQGWQQPGYHGYPNDLTTVHQHSVQQHTMQHPPMNQYSFQYPRIYQPNIQQHTSLQTDNHTRPLVIQLQQNLDHPMASPSPQSTVVSNEGSETQLSDILLFE